MASFYTGNTGASTGPHLDFRVWDVEKGGYVDPTRFTGALQVGGKSLTDQYGVTSGYGMRNHPTKGGRRMHHGIDYGTPVGTEITVKGGRLIGTVDDAGGGGITNQYAFRGEDGRNYDLILMHGNKDNKITHSDFVRDFDYSTLGDTETPLGDTETPLDGGGQSPATPQQEAVERVKQYKAFTAGDVVKNFGNDFDSMKSDRLGKALAGAQESIVQKRMDAGTNFGGQMIEVDKPVTKDDDED